MNSFVINEFNAKASGNHWEGAEAPMLPIFCVIVGLFQGTKVSKGPSYLITVTLHIPIS